MWNRTAREILVGMCTLWTTYTFLNIALSLLVRRSVVTISFRLLIFIVFSLHAAVLYPVTLERLLLYSLNRDSLGIYGMAIV